VLVDPGMRYPGTLLVVVVSVVSESRAIVRGLVAAKAWVVRRRLAAVCLREPVSHVGKVKLLVHTFDHIPVHVVDRIWAGAWAAAPTDDVSAELATCTRNLVMTCGGCASSHQVSIHRLWPRPLLCQTRLSNHAPCPVPARGQVRRQEVAGVSVDDVVEPGRHRLKPTSGWVQSATSLIAIEGPVTPVRGGGVHVVVVLVKGDATTEIVPS